MKTPGNRPPTTDPAGLRLIVRRSGAIQLDILERAVEPWLELIMLELGRVVTALDARDGEAAAGILKRVCSVQRHLVSQLEILETLDAETQAPDHGSHDCAEWTVLRELVRICREQLWPSYERFLASRSVTLWTIYEDESNHPLELRLGEGLATFDRSFQRWRTRWRALQRSLGGQFLQGTHLYETSESWPPFFPALWNARAQ